MAVVAVAALVVLITAKGQLHRWQAFALLAVAALFLSAGYADSLDWPGPYAWDSRLVLFPYILVFWALGWLASGTLAWRRIIALALMGMVVVSAATHWYGDIPQDYHWRRQIRELHAGQRDELVAPCMPGFPVTVSASSLRDKSYRDVVY